MFARLCLLLRQPRKPLAGLALAAIAGILLGEGVFLLAKGSFPLDTAAAIFALAVALFLALPREATCWTAVIVGFAILHLFTLQAVPARTLARALAPAAGEDQAKLSIVQAVGRIVDEPRTTLKPPADWRFPFRLEAVTVNGSRWPCHAEVMAIWKDAARKPLAGDRLAVVGLARNVAGPRNPGEFDYAGYLRRRGIRSELMLSGIADVLPVTAAEHFWERPILGPLAQRVHTAMDATLRLDLQDDAEVSALVTTILLGLRDDPGLGELEPIFQRTGTLHYFAIDGLKLALLGWLLLAVLTSGGLPRGWARALCWLLLLGYALTAGLGAATLRAVVVAAVLLGGELLDRPVRAGNSLGAAAAALLLVDTNQLFTLGFELSFLVVFAILTLTPPLQQGLGKLGAPDPFLPRLLFPWWLRAREGVRRFSVDLVSVALAAWVGSLPLVLIVFHLFSPVSILANVVIFPLVTGMFGLAAFSVAGGALWQGWAIWMNNANWVLAKTLLGVLRFFDAIPGGSLHVASPERWRWPAPAAELTVLDLGPGRALVLHAGPSDWLIDAGRASDYRRAVLPFLQAGGIDRLDGLLLTQGDSDHLAGAPSALADLRPRRVALSVLTNRSPSVRSLHALLADKHLLTPPVAAGTAIALAGAVELRVLYPPGDLPPATAAGSAMIIRLDAAGWRVLLLGDSAAASHRWLAAQQNAAEAQCDVLVVGPQTDDGEAAAAFLASLHPRLLIRERARQDGEGSAAKAAPLTALDQQSAGAVTLRFYQDRLEARGFLRPGVVVIPATRP